MRRAIVGCLMVLGMVMGVMGDSIDDAEAKRRGVPVAQVIAERKAAAEKAAATRDGSTGTAAASRPATATANKPATSSRPVAATVESEPKPGPDGVVQVDDLVRKFPMYVGKLAPKGKRVTVEGKLIYLKDNYLPLQAGQTAKRTFAVYLLGKTQGDETPGHVTCIMAVDSADKAGKAPYGSVVQVSGIAGDVTGSMDRFEMDECDDVKVLRKEEPAEERLLGEWKGAYTGVTPHLKVDFAIKRDQTAQVTFSKDGEGSAMIKGKWHVSLNEPNVIDLALEKMHDLTELDMSGPRLRVASIPDVVFTECPIEFRKMDGMPLKETLAEAQKQAIQWVKANCVSKQEEVLAGLNRIMQEAAPREGGFGFTLDGTLTRSHKTTELCIAQDQLCLFELTEGQAKNVGLDPGTTKGKVLADSYTTGARAIEVKSLELEGGNSVDANKPIKGKITLRALTRGGCGGCHVALVYGGNRDEIGVNLDLDDETVEFSFQAMMTGRTLDQAKPRFGNEVVMSFFVSAEPLERDSNMKAMLVDVKYPEK